MAEKKKNDLGQSEVQSRYEKGQEQGFIGNEVDNTPNKNYTVDGVTGKPAPTPETDDKAAAKATAGSDS